jgi:hypothetical protein
MIQICNAELTDRHCDYSFPGWLRSWPEAGVGYSNYIPWQAEAGVTAVIFLAGLSPFKYITEALAFEDSTPSALSTAEVRLQICSEDEWPNSHWNP